MGACDSIGEETRETRKVLHASKLLEYQAKVKQQRIGYKENEGGSGRETTDEYTYTYDSTTQTGSDRTSSSGSDGSSSSETSSSSAQNKKPTRPMMQPPTISPTGQHLTTNKINPSQSEERVSLLGSHLEASIGSGTTTIRQKRSWGGKNNEINENKISITDFNGESNNNNSNTTSPSSIKKTLSTPQPVVLFDSPNSETSKKQQNNNNNDDESNRPVYQTIGKNSPLSDQHRHATFKKSPTLNKNFKDTTRHKSEPTSPIHENNIMEENFYEQDHEENLSPYLSKGSNTVRLKNKFMKTIKKKGDIGSIRLKDGIQSVIESIDNTVSSGKEGSWTEDEDEDENNESNEEKSLGGSSKSKTKKKKGSLSAGIAKGKNFGVGAIKHTIGRSDGGIASKLFKGNQSEESENSKSKKHKSAGTVGARHRERPPRVSNMNFEQPDQHEQKQVKLNKSPTFSNKTSEILTQEIPYHNETQRQPKYIEKKEIPSFGLDEGESDCANEAGEEDREENSSSYYSNNNNNINESFSQQSKEKDSFFDLMTSKLAEQEEFWNNIASGVTNFEGAQSMMCDFLSVIENIRQVDERSERECDASMGIGDLDLIDTHVPDFFQENEKYKSLSQSSPSSQRNNKNTLSPKQLAKLEKKEEQDFKKKMERQEKAEKQIEIDKEKEKDRQRKERMKQREKSGQTMRNKRPLTNQQRELQSTKDVLFEVRNKLIERGEKIDRLDRNTEELANEAAKFKGLATQLREEMERRKGIRAVFPYL